jgi:NADH-quinone oxidoreductase subunit G
VSEKNGKGALEGDGKPVRGAPTNAPGSTGLKPTPPPGAQKAPKNPGFVTCTVDGKEVVARPGTNMIEAARQAGADIPYYCYHPRLSIAANCRMCLVEVSSSPKLVPACQTPLSEGLAVKTTTAVVKDSQRSVLEFILLNHPVDCAICDQAGECKLQDYYARYDFMPSRMGGPKVLKEKRKVLGPMVVLDQERCILCTRCVRFMNEVAQEPQLAMLGRGSAERIDVFPGSELDSNYAGNTVDICPVGALLNRDFRFRARAWFLSEAPSICTGCSRGCNIFVDFFGEETHRYRPRENDQVNKSWMCDQGRLSYKYVNKERILTPQMGRGSDAREATRAEALAFAARKLKAFINRSELAVLASPVASNEDLLACLAFARDALGAKGVYLGGRPEGPADQLLMTADKNPNRTGLTWIAGGLGLKLHPFSELLEGLGNGSIKALYAIGAEAPIAGPVVSDALGKADLLVTQATNPGQLTALADVILPACTHVEDEGSFANIDRIIQRFRPAYPPIGESQPHWAWASHLSRELGLTTVYGSAREVFRKLAVEVEELSTFEWDKAAPPAQPVPGLSPAPAGADGRPPGYREWGSPRVKGI